MELRKYIGLLILGILEVSYAQDIYVVAPSSLRLNSDEIIAVTIDGDIGGLVSVSVQDYPRNQKTIFTTNDQVEPGNPKMIKIRLDVAQFPEDFLTTPGKPKLVSLIVCFPRAQKELQIPISSESGYMFIQSDKPIYTPLDSASFRIIPLTEEGLPSTERFQFQIRNPDNIVVFEKMFNVRNKKLPYYFESYRYKFPALPVLGDWSATVRYGNNLDQNSTLNFELQEYVLPTFTVNLRTPDVILPNSGGITIDVEAQYVYGKKVNGLVSYRLGVKREHSSDVFYFATDKPRLLIDGKYTIRVSTMKLKDHREVGWFPKIEGSFLVVQVTVVDDATGNKKIEEDSSTRFSKSPFIISFKRCLKDFKPGLTSVFEADITYFDGQPAQRISTKIRAVADNGKKLNADQSTSRSDENGKVSFVIHPEIHHKTVTLTLETDDPRYGESQAKGTFVQQAYQSKNNAYIAISRSSPMRLRPGDTFGRDIHFDPIGIENIYFLVVARGRIQTIKKTKEGKYKNVRMQFPITYDMVPSFRVVVFAHYRDDLIADSLKIDLGKECSPEAEVTVEPVFQVPEPASHGKIIIRGTKDTSVALFGVDEAVYALSRKDLLTKAKMFDTLASHDLGCGSGGGVNINSVLGDAGIMIGTNKFSPSHSHSCTEIKRRKRSLAEDLVSNYTGMDQLCCGLGLRTDIHYRSCEDRYYVAKNSLDVIHPNCSDVFLECCLRGEEEEIPGSVYIKGNIMGKNTGLKFLDPQLIEQYERQTTVRKDFRETWIDMNIIIGPDNKHEEEVSLPHSITTWVIQAVSVSPTHGICVAEPQKLVSFQKMFLHLNLPYSIKINEQVEIQGTVFNYGEKEIVAEVRMHDVEDLCSGIKHGGKGKPNMIHVSANSASTVTFSLIPLKTGKFPIRFDVMSNAGADIIEKTLLVDSGAVREERNVVVRLDPRNQQKRKELRVEYEMHSDIIDPTQNLQVTTIKLDLPLGTVPGTVTCSMSAIGDFVGPVVEASLSNPDSMFHKPHGCGEQNMMFLAPTIYTMRYLKATGRLTADRKSKGQEFIRQGYDNELKFRKTDGSYSVWAHTPTSTWLTAFVMKVLCQATEFINIDNNVLSSGIGWLIRNQQADGSYIEHNKIYHREMMGGVDGIVSMTAFALIALEECKNDDANLLLTKKQAAAFLESRINTVHTPLSVAVIAYALALGDSSKKQAANERLLSMATKNPGNNYMYWPTKNSALDIETAGYGLLTQLLFDDIDASNSIINWINTKQLKSGCYKSTQDTVIALQSLSEFAIRTNGGIINMVSNITKSKDKTFHKVLTFNKENALQLQEVKIDDTDGMIYVHTSGYGMGTLSLKLHYNVIKSEKEICKFAIKETVTAVRVFNKVVRNVKLNLDREPESRNRREVQSDLFLESTAKDIIRRTKRQNKEENEDLAYNISICVKYLGDVDSEMSIVDVGIFSGFEPVIDDLNRLEADRKHLIQFYEKSKRGVVFYLERVPASRDYCFTFQVYREYKVGNTESGIIKVYDYYNPDASCTKFYGPGGNSHLINAICHGNVCACAEGGCPKKDPFSKFYTRDEHERRDKIKQSFCDDYDYAWKVTLHGRLRKDERFLNITLLVEEVIKPGTEREEDVLRKTRIFRCKKHCRIAQFYPGAKYLILGQDPPVRRNGNETYYQYIIDDQSIVFHWKAHDENNELLKEDLEFVTSDLKNFGCEQ